MTACHWAVSRLVYVETVAVSQLATAGDDDRSTRAQEKADDRKGGPGHLVLVAVVFAVPVLKLAWTLGGGDAARDAFIAMEPSNWPDVLVGMLLSDAPLSAVLAVVVSRTTYAYFAAKSGDRRLSEGSPLSAALSMAVVPLAFGLVMGAFHGAWWGLAVAVVAYALRLGVIAEYRTGRRTREGHRVRGGSSGWPMRCADAAWAASLVLTMLVLPFLALASALDGRAWTSVVECDVDTGGGTHRARLIELSRKGSGVVAWDIEGEGVVNGVNCRTVEDDVIREPWWRA